MSNGNIVLGTIGADAHMIGAWVLQKGLSGAGMGILDCEGLRDKCVEAGLKNIILYAGGNVAASHELERNWPEIEKRFRDMGFNRVYRNTVKVDEVVATLKSDLGIDG